jgi:hypothetical protein
LNKNDSKIHIILIIVSLSLVLISNLTIYIPSQKIADLNFYLVDTLYPILYFAFYVITLSYFIKRIFKEKIYFIILLLPLIGIICDYGETILVNSFIKNINITEENIPEKDVMIVNYFIGIKYIAGYLSLLLIIILMVLHIIIKLRIRMDNRK